jgi:hypothetical protein
MKAIGLLLLATLLVGIIGCENNSKSTASSPLNGTLWNLTAWTLSSLNPADFTITAKFADGKLTLYDQGGNESLIFDVASR